MEEKLIDFKKEIEDFKKSLEDLSLDELKAKEKDLIKDIEKNEKFVSSKIFKLPSGNKKLVFKYIRDFLDKQSYQWQYCASVVKMYEVWMDENADEIPYPVLDSTLRTLGGMQYTGIKEWKNVICINDYFSTIRDEYINLTNSIYKYSEMHSAIISKMELFEVVEPVSD